MRRLGRFAAWAAAILALAWIAAVLASPMARRGYGLWLTARGLRLPGDAREQVEVSAYVDHMPRLCLNRPCDAAWPLNLIVTLPTDLQDVQADSAWIIAGPAVYGLRLERGPGPFGASPHRWAGASGTELPLELMRVGVLVRIREPGRPARMLRFWAVPLDYGW